MIEEAAFVDERIFRSIIVPILVNNAILLALSTVGSQKTNYFNQLLARGVFLVHRNSYVCDDCVKAGIRKQCIHKQGSRPHWANDEERLNDIYNLVGEEGRETYEMETLGLDPLEDEASVFPVERIKDLFARPRVALNQKIRFLFMFVDPCAGSKKPEDQRPSNFGVVTIAEPGHIVMGIEEFHANEEKDYAPFLIDHISRIKAHPFCEKAVIVLGVEIGTGFTAPTVQDMIMRHVGTKNVVCMNDHDTIRGRSTSYETKIRMAEVTRTYLNIGDIAFWEHLVTHKDDTAILKTLREQLVNYQRVATETKTGSTVIYTGKTGGKRDDLAVSFQLDLNMINDFFRDPKYSKHHIPAR